MKTRSVAGVHPSLCGCTSGAANPAFRIMKKPVVKAAAIPKAMKAVSKRRSCTCGGAKVMKKPMIKAAKAPKSMKAVVKVSAAPDAKAIKKSAKGKES